MRNTILLLACAAISGCSAREHASPESGGAEYRAGEWRLVEDWPDLPADVIIGAVSDVALDGAGNVIVFHRAGRTFNQVGLDSTRTIADNTILELRPDGRLSRQWGAGMFYMPHSIAVDAQDRVWIVDTGAQQVHRLTRSGEFTLSVGVSREGGWSRTHFDRPTDVLLRSDGSFHVSDGYLNARVVSFDADGRYLHEWGGRGTAPGQFATPHGIATDPQGQIYVADRENRRLQQFDRNGTFLRQWPEKVDSTSSRIADVAVSKSGIIYVATWGGGSAVKVLNGRLQEIDAIPTNAAIRIAAHGLAVSGDSVIYLADTGGRRIWKLVR